MDKKVDVVRRIMLMGHVSMSMADSVYQRMVDWHRGVPMPMTDNMLRVYLGQTPTKKGVGSLLDFLESHHSLIERTR